MIKTDESIEFIEILASSGEIVNKALCLVNNDEILALYRAMLLTRTFDKKAIALQRTGKLGTFPSSYGQEAIYAAIGMAMAATDVLCPYYRDHGALFQRGVKIEEILAYWGGDERGSNYAEQKYDMPLCVPIASQCLHAVGIGYAMQYKKQRRACLVTIGDGGTSKGDFYEAMNFAALYKLPVVFVVNNNKWAISVPLEKQTAAATIAQKAVAAGFKGIRVDGNDVIACHRVIKMALEQAYDGEGPSLIEAETYRLCDHTTADDAGRYVAEDKLSKAKELEPMIRLTKYLQQQQILSQQSLLEMNAEITSQITNAVDNYLSTPLQTKQSMFINLFAQPTCDITEQMQELEN